METVVLTGGLGRSGRWIADRLLDDYEVVCVDVDHPGFEAVPRGGLDFRAADLADRGEALDLLAELDPDAVVHWAALPSPTRHAGGRVFETNALAAYNVLWAAGRAGARVVQASSESAYGYPFASEPSPPEELPITESHPLRPEDPYGLSKVAAEEVGKAVSRRFGVPVVSARPSWIQYPGEYSCRREGHLEEIANGVGNFWSYVDVRDVADFVAAALASPPEGHVPVHVAAAENYRGRPTRELLEEFFGELPEGRSSADDRSALSVERARTLLDWEPSHSWREAADADVEPPRLLSR